MQYYSYLHVDDAASGILFAMLKGGCGEAYNVADERSEIAACRGGMPQLDVGPMTDVVTGLDKGASLRLLVRSMAPGVAAVDEIAGEEDAARRNEEAISYHTKLLSQLEPDEAKLFLDVLKRIVSAIDAESSGPNRA